MQDLDPRLRMTDSPSTGAVSRTSDSADGASLPGLGTLLHQQTTPTHSSNNQKPLDSTSSATDAAAAALEEEAKKARACEACRGLKVRCEPDLNDETQPCKRCKKAGRNCVVTAPTRKRQKKTDSRVADLEKKIDALTATLQARGAGQQQSSQAGGVNSREERRMEEERERDKTGANVPWGGVQPAKTWHSSTTTQVQQPERHGSGDFGRRNPSDTGTAPQAGQKRKDRESIGSEKLSERYRQPQAQYPPTSYKCRNPDFIERGLITLKQANTLLARYNNDMVHHLPAIVIPHGMSAAELSSTRPVLFSAIMATATTDQPDLQRTLQKELMTCFAEKVFLAGEKSLDTVQAMLVAVIWYWPPENFEELKFYQLIHTASVMAIDIGLGRRTSNRRAEPPFGLLRDPNSKKPLPPDPTSLESRRTWLACYLLATNAAMALHRPVLIRWTSFMAESTEILENSHEALPSDKHIASLVWAHKVSEDMAQFSSDDADGNLDLSKPATQFALKGMERELQRRRAAIPEHETPATVFMTFNTINLFIHELLLNTSSHGPDDRQPFSTEALTTSLLSPDSIPSTLHISCLSTCLTSIHAIFDTFLSIPIDSTRCLPVYFFVRVAYALVILIKMAFSAAKPGAELGKVMDAEDMKVQFYLDALVGKFRETSLGDKCRPAAKFLIVLVMLRTWVGRQVKEGNISVATTTAAGPPQRIPQHGHSEGSKAIAPPPPPHRAASSQQPASTPLHLLSEVASNRNTTANDDSNTGGVSGTTPFVSNFFSGLQRVPQPFFANTAGGSTPSTTTSGDAPVGGESNSNGVADTNSWASQNQSAMAFGPAMPMDPNMVMGALDLEGVDFSSAGLMTEPWFTDVFQGMPNMENMFFF